MIISFYKLKEWIKLHGTTKQKNELALNTSNPNYLRRLAIDSNKNVRKKVSTNLNTPKDVLKELSNDSDEEVRIEISRNPNTPKDVLKGLSKDTCYWVRTEIAKNINTPEEILKELAASGNENDVIGNPSAPVECLVKFISRIFNDAKSIVVHTQIRQERSEPTGEMVRGEIETSSEIFTGWVKGSRKIISYRDGIVDESETKKARTKALEQARYRALQILKGYKYKKQVEDQLQREEIYL